MNFFLYSRTEATNNVKEAKKMHVIKIFNHMTMIHPGVAIQSTKPKRAAINYAVIPLCKPLLDTHY